MHIPIANPLRYLKVNFLFGYLEHITSNPIYQRIAKFASRGKPDLRMTDIALATSFLMCSRVYRQCNAFRDAHHLMLCLSDIKRLKCVAQSISGSVFAAFFSFGCHLAFCH